MHRAGWGLPGGSVLKKLPTNAGDARVMGSIPELGKSPWGRNGNSLQYFCLDRGPWWATVLESQRASEKTNTHSHTHTQNRMKGICEVWILDGEQFYKAEDIGTEHLRMAAGFMQNCRIIQWLGTVNILAANHAFEKGLPHRNNG